MKKTLMIAALMLAACGASASEAVKITFELSKDDKVINSASIPTLDGKGEDYQAGDMVGYLKDAQQVGDTLELTPGTVESGLKLTATPHITSEGKVQLKVTGKHAELISLDTKQLDKPNAAVQVPNLDEHKIDLLFTAKSGEKLEFPWVSPKTNSRYVLTFTTTIVENPNQVN